MALDTVGRRVGRGEVERRLVAHPAGERGTQGVAPSLGDKEERRGARSTAEILVGTAHSEVGLHGMQIDWNHAHAVGEVPEHERAVFVRDARQVLDVVEGTVAKVDRGQRDDADIVAEIAVRIGEQIRLRNPVDWVI